MNTVDKLDQLAEYQAYLALRKQELIDAVKIPAEVQAALAEHAQRKAAHDDRARESLERVRATKQKELAALVRPVLPPEYVVAMNDYNEERDEIENCARIQEANIASATQFRKAETDSRFGPQIEKAYADVATRKAEISAEFDGLAVAAQENIDKLTAEIKAETMVLGSSVKGTYYHAVYCKGRVTWITDMLDGIMEAMPGLAKARKEGASSVTLREI